jgi:hypothetical protein
MHVARTKRLKFWRKVKLINQKQRQNQDEPRTRANNPEPPKPLGYSLSHTVNHSPCTSGDPPCFVGPAYPNPPVYQPSLPDQKQPHHTSFAACRQRPTPDSRTASSIGLEGRAMLGAGDQSRPSRCLINRRLLFAREGGTPLPPLCEHGPSRRLQNGCDSGSLKLERQA